MHAAILGSHSLASGAVARLAAEGRLLLWRSGGEELLSSHPERQLLVGSSAGSYVLHNAVLACRQGRLGDVRWLLDNESPDVGRVSLRLRPWLRAVHLLSSGSAPDDDTLLPAPLVVSDSVEEILEGWGEPSVRWSPTPCPFPREIQIQTTSRCAMGCPFCPKAKQETEEGAMSDALFESILEQCSLGSPDVLELYFHGEPQDDPKLVGRSRQAKEACPVALVSIVTHSQRLTEAAADQLAAGGLDVVFVSFNPWPGFREAEVAAGLERLSQAAAILHDGGKRLVVTTLRNLIPWGYRSRFRKLCDNHGLPVESFRATSRSGAVDLHPIQPTIPPGADNAPGHGNPWVCERPFTRAYVRWNGSLAQCCEDWSYTRELGNLESADLATLWLSTEYRALRQELLDRTYKGPCALCDYGGASMSMESDKTE